MTAEQRLRTLTDALEAAKKIAAEKRTFFRSCLSSFNRDVQGYDSLLRSALAFASAADDVYELDEQHEDAMAEVQYEEIKREQTLDLNLK